MSWRGQGGKRAKGRRGDQDPELDNNTAWLAELEQEAAARADDEDEDDWASTLRGRRASGPDPAAAPGPPPHEPSWAPDPGPPPPLDDRSYGPGPGGASTAYGPEGTGTGYRPEDAGTGYRPEGAGTAYGSDAWTAEPTPRERPLADDPGPPPPAPDPDPDWSWRAPAVDAYGEPGGTAPTAPAPEAFGSPRPDAGSGNDWAGSRADPDEGDWRSAGVDTPTGTWEPVEPVGREPDYPALFGELYRRSAGQQDPIWEAPPAAEPPPEQGPPDPQQAAWPFEETTQSWEPSDGSFIWPADELPSTSAEWNTPAPPSWTDDPQPPAAPSAHTTPAPSGPDEDQTAAWSSPWADQPGSGNGAPAAPTGPPFASPGPAVVPPGPPPADWAAAIPTDVPAASRAVDPASTRAWRSDEAVEAEPGVPLGPGPRPPGGEAAASRTARLRGPAGEGPGSRTSRLQAAAGQGPAPPVADPGAFQDPVSRVFGTRAADRAVPLPDTEPDEAPRKRRRDRQAGERQARAWPRIVAVISWIVLVMVVCWFYVFPWLERVLPENF
jgi:hypothetical protein